jgi:hypothetical protein
MLGTKSIALALLAAAFCCARHVEASPVQGGWRQWEVRLRDGRRLEANPLGAPDDGHLSLSVGAYERREHRVARAAVRVVAALPVPGDSLPAMPDLALCDDVIVRRDGTGTIGRITLARVRWSEGVVAQRGDTVDLRDVAYLVFAAQGSASGNCRRGAIRQEPDVTYPGTHPGSPYPVGIQQTPRPCADAVGRNGLNQCS